jgi:deoxycytidylate deaminase
MTKPQDITALVYDRRGRLLSVGRNSYHKTHPVQARMAQETAREVNDKGLAEKIYLHAEVDALVKMRGDWSKAHRLVITRYTKDGKPASAKPCKICERMIRLAGIEHIEHT